MSESRPPASGPGIALRDRIAERNMLSDLQSLRTAFAALADGAAQVEINRVDPAVATALERTLIDSLGVALAGALTSEIQSLVDAWPAPPGECSVWGTGVSTDSQTAALLVGASLCSLELDEGNKAARGHPGAHVIPVAIAEAQRLGSAGDELLSAILAGYEVATRIATAFRPRQGLHPHGHWGAIGAAVAVGRLCGFDAAQLAEAMDAASALALATPFSSALDGSFVRNTWVGVAGSNGITAARLVRAGLGSQDGTAASTFGSLLGEIDVERIDTDFTTWTITQGYFKRHASCAYTHPPADAAIELRERHSDVTTRDIVAIRVGTHSLAAPLSRQQPATRLAAMFSIPHVVAVALRDGSVLPESFDAASLADSEFARLRDVTTVTVDPELESRLPLARGARVSMTLTDGRNLEAVVPNAIGDSDHLPFGVPEIAAKLATLLGDARAGLVIRTVEALRGAPDVRIALSALSELDLTREGEP
jgi:Uncharacterized protein involved in propionate catabolism